MFLDLWHNRILNNIGEVTIEDKSEFVPHHGINIARGLLNLSLFI